MYITPIQQTSFGYGKKEVAQFAAYALEKQKGSIHDLNKKFEPALVDLFINTKKITVDRALQNWKIDTLEKTTDKPDKITKKLGLKK